MAKKNEVEWPAIWHFHAVGFSSNDFICFLALETAKLVIAIRSCKTEDEAAREIKRRAK